MQFLKNVNEPKMRLNVESFGSDNLGFPHGNPCFDNNNNKYVWTILWASG